MSSFMRLIAFFALAVQILSTTTAFIPTAYRSYLSTPITQSNKNVIATTTSNSQLYMASTTTSSKSPIQANDKILVFGGTGGVGQLVTRKLRARENNYNVCVVARDAVKAKELLTAEDIEYIELNLVGDAKAADDELQLAMEGCTGIVISVGTTAFPTKRWQGGNTPQAIDEEAVSRIAKIACDIPTLRRMVLLTSVGVSRTNEFPFLILNLFGVLDAKRTGEDAVKAAATSSGFSYSIVRPGRLVGGPYTNLDLAKLFKVEGGASNGVTVESGDTLLGDCKRDVTAEAVVQCLENTECNDIEFSMISNEEPALTDREWSQEFLRMKE